MNPRRSLAVTERILRDLKNDKRTIAMMFLAPILVMFVFGLAFSGDVSDVSVVVVNGDTGYTDPRTNTMLSISGMVISNLDEGLMRITYLDDEGEAVHAVERGDAYAALVFPRDLTRNVLMKLQNASFTGDTSIHVFLDRSNINVANAVMKGINDAVLDTVREMGVHAPLTVDAGSPVYGENAGFMDFLVPGVLAFAVYLLTTLLTLISFVGERTSGTLARLMVTPLTEGELVLGYALAFGMIGILQTAILLGLGISVFNITVVGNVGLAFGMIALLAVVSLSLGILLSSLAKREAQAVQFIPFIVLPAFLLAGIFWPIEAIPLWLRPASYLVPPTYAVDACRSVMIRGWGLERIWWDVLALLSFAVVFLGLATLSLKRRRD